MEKGKDFGSEYGFFGKDKLRAQRIRNVLEHSSVRPIGEISRYLSESSSLRRGHFFGYYGNIKDFHNTTILIGLCCEKEGPSLSIYPSLEAASSIRREKGCQVRAIIPTYEFAALGLYPNNDIDQIGSFARRVLKRYDFEVIDTIHDKDYLLRRLDMAFRIQRYVNKENRDPVGDEQTGMQLACLEIADIVLSLEENDTLLIADQGSAIPAAKAKFIAKRILKEKNNELGCLFYSEPLDLAEKELMYYADNKRKIYLKPGEEDKIRSAATNGRTLDEFRRNGGNYFQCIVGEVESLISENDSIVNENCRKCARGEFEGCAEHKELVILQLEKFGRRFE